MLEKITAYLKAKKLYEVTLGLILFIAFFIINKIFTLPIFMLPFLVFMGCRIFLKTRVKAEHQPLVTAFALQFSQYLMILIAAFQNPFAKLIDIFVIFWGTNALWKKPTWRSGGIMIAYNVYLIYGYVLGIIHSLAQNNITSVRYAALFTLVSAATIYFIYDGVKIILANQKEDSQIMAQETEAQIDEQNEDQIDGQSTEKQEQQ